LKRLGGSKEPLEALKWAPPSASGLEVGLLGSPKAMGTAGPQLTSLEGRPRSTVSLAFGMIRSALSVSLSLC